MVKHFSLGLQLCSGHRLTP